MERWQGRMRVAECRGRDQRAGAEEVPGSGDVVAGFVPVVGQAEEAEMGDVEGHEDDGKIIQRGTARQAGARTGFLQKAKGQTRSCEPADTFRELVDGPLGRAVGLRFEREGAEGLLVLRDVLAEDVPEGFGLLRTQEDGLVIADGDLVGRCRCWRGRRPVEIPYADAHLDAVGVGLAVIGRLRHVDLGLLRIGTHGSTRLPRQGGSALVPCGTHIMDTSSCRERSILLSVVTRTRSDKGRDHSPASNSVWQCHAERSEASAVAFRNFRVKHGSQTHPFG